MWMCLNCGGEITEDEALNIMAEYDEDKPVCCGGAMVDADYFENPLDLDD